jgi:hypothetical protein
MYLKTTTSVAARITKAARIKRRLAKHTPMISISSDEEMYAEEGRPTAEGNSFYYYYQLAKSNAELGSCTEFLCEYLILSLCVAKLSLSLTMANPGTKIL